MEPEDFDSWITKYLVIAILSVIGLFSVVVWGLSRI